MVQKVPLKVFKYGLSYLIFNSLYFLFILLNDLTSLLTVSALFYNLFSFFSEYFKKLIWVSLFFLLFLLNTYLFLGLNFRGDLEGVIEF